MSTEDFTNFLMQPITLVMDLIMPKGRKRQTGSVRTGVSLTPLVQRWAQEMMRQKGYDNFSAYIADLIRRDKERQEARDQERKKKPGSDLSSSKPGKESAA